MTKNPANRELVRVLEELAAGAHRTGDALEDIAAAIRWSPDPASGAHRERIAGVLKDDAGRELRGAQEILEAA